MTRLRDIDAFFDFFGDDIVDSTLQVIDAGELEIPTGGNKSAFIAMVVIAFERKLKNWLTKKQQEKTSKYYVSIEKHFDAFMDTNVHGNTLLGLIQEGMEENQHEIESKVKCIIDKLSRYLTLDLEDMIFGDECEAIESF